MTLGIKGIHSLNLYVREQARYAGLLNWMGFSNNHGVFSSGACDMRCTQPVSTDCTAAQFLTQHPDGLGQIAFIVHNVSDMAQHLAQRGATLTSDINETVDGRWVDITTPIGDVTFRFIETGGSVCDLQDQARYRGFDHFTCHFLTLAPVVWWFETVMGFQKIWEFQFHTSTHCESMRGKVGTGMRSVVMRCPVTGVTFALNEPLRPDFSASQVARFVRDNGGAGIQHVALNVRDICAVVEELDPARFLRTPGCYYDDLHQRLPRCGMRGFTHDLDRLRPLGVLVDAEPGEGHLLQIFMQPLSSLFGDQRAGPLFFELIERGGARGFGEGNFQALFEAVARAQQA